jgi:hypothetical protein
MKTLLVLLALVALVLFFPALMGSIVGVIAFLIVWAANLAAAHWLIALVVVVVLYLWLK